MKHLGVSGAVRPLKFSLGIKWLVLFFAAFILHLIRIHICIPPAFKHALLYAVRVVDICLLIAFTRKKANRLFSRSGGSSRKWFLTGMLARRDISRLFLGWFKFL